MAITLPKKCHSQVQRKRIKKRLRASISATIALINWVTMTPLHGSEEELSQKIIMPLAVPKVIYGTDDRQEANLYPDRLFREKAKSVAGMVSKNRLAPDFRNENLTNFFKKSAKRAFNLCENERFALQNVLPICSGFLAAPDIIVTAGHCIETQRDCENFSWVFDYTEGTQRLKNEHIYNCKEIIGKKLKSNNFTLKDYAVIRLDRPVTDREPLPIRMRGNPNWGEDLLVIGHPIGLPLKISDNAEVKMGNILGIFKPVRNLIRKRDFFMASLDTFVGNSGSPVFNKESGLVEGILVEGAEDFEEDPGLLCNRTLVKKDSSLVTDEKVFRARKIKPLMDILKAKN
jgi:hypothetical protein